MKSSIRPNNSQGRAFKAKGTRDVAKCAARRTGNLIQIPVNSTDCCAPHMASWSNVLLLLQQQQCRRREAAGAKDGPG